MGRHAPATSTQNVVATLNVVDAMAEAGVERILLASSGSVYGECPVVPTPEDAPFPQQTSLYGASKVAAEGFLGAWAEAGRLSATVFRFVSDPRAPLQPRPRDRLHGPAERAPGRARRAG